MNRVSVIIDRVPQVLDELRKLTGKQVLVGIPDATTDRAQAQGPITNAALGYIHEFGSPAANIPARPFLTPGVQKSLPTATRALRKAADAALDGNRAQVEKNLQIAGMVAASSAQLEIQTGNFEPLKPATIANRRRSRQTQSMRPEERRYLELIAKGVAPAAAQAEAGIRPLINTGDLRDSITSVVRSKA